MFVRGIIWFLSAVVCIGMADGQVFSRMRPVSTPSQESAYPLDDLFALLTLARALEEKSTGRLSSTYCPDDVIMNLVNALVYTATAHVGAEPWSPTQHCHPHVPTHPPVTHVPITHPIHPPTNCPSNTCNLDCGNNCADNNDLTPIWVLPNPEGNHPLCTDDGSNDDGKICPINNAGGITEIKSNSISGNDKASNTNNNVIVDILSGNKNKDTILNTVKNEDSVIQSVQSQ